jgi:hypothetical protein
LDGKFVLFNLCSNFEKEKGREGLFPFLFYKQTEGTELSHLLEVMCLVRSTSPPKLDAHDLGSWLENFWLQVSNLE